MALTPQQEKFAQAVVALNNQSAAYRAAYDVGGTTKFTTVVENASRLAREPEVAARIQTLRDMAAATVSLPTAAQRIAELREIENADPREIMGLNWVNCRHCRGEGHAFQWRDDAEYAQAYDAAMLDPRGRAPNIDGGMGFNGTLEPVPDCPVCWGVGVQRPYCNDTAKLSRAATRLYKGVKIKGNGDMEILVHDQLKVRDMLNRIQGIYKDNTASLPVTPAAATAAQVAAAKTPEERARTYLRLVSGS